MAAVPPTEVAESLEEFLEPRRSAAAYRWTPAHQWHLTLAFAEAVPERSLEDFEELLGEVAARTAPIELRIGGGGAFPHVTGAKVVYAAVQADPDDHTRLERLAVGARSAANRTGIVVDGGRFRPHVTVARSGRPVESSSWVRLLDAYAGPPWHLDEVVLVESHLGGGPHRQTRGRPRHEVVATFALGG